MGNLFCCVQVDQSTFEEELDAGCHCLPWFLGSQLAGHLSTLRLQQMGVRCETKKDNVFVNIASIQYRALADKVSDAFYKLSNSNPGRCYVCYGYVIVQTLIVDIEPDEHVKRAMNEINAELGPGGEAEAKYLSGLGIARQRQAIVDGLRESVLGFSENMPGTTAKDVMDMVLVTQYFDTMKKIGAASKSSAIFFPHGPGDIRDVATQIQDGLLQASSHQ
ncbi:hypothetical protein POPTR_015G065001v4 [Populus trichocarpa]|uniref:Uncharacterized protein n=1 Tax=Populus trichocarpa TaxID=3694 RepID=A0ACC0RWH4_POPTR|nr:hypothetical protein POPTR_015G065001v4 [Populus trichocarpa]